MQESHIISVYKKFYFAVKNYFNTRMIGGVIEGSNQKDFQNVDTLLLIKEAPYRLYTVAYLIRIGHIGMFAIVVEKVVIVI